MGDRDVADDCRAGGVLLGWNNRCLAEGSGHGDDPAVERAGVGAVVGLPCCHGFALSGAAAWLWAAARAVPFLLATDAGGRSVCWP